MPAWVSVNQIELVCASCGVSFSMPQCLYDRKAEDHVSYWCPNGHQWHVGKTDKERRMEQLEREAKWKANTIESLRRDVRSAKRAATKSRGRK